MKSVVFITALITKVVRGCDLCHQIKRVEYLVVDKDDKMFNVCQECRDKILEADPNS